MITAPFNFVPLSEEVFFPEWAEDVSHDVPFEDAQSGTIDITMTAKSPIFVRDGAEETKFCNHKGTQYIPGSSVKGMVRSVLEIMSFSKLDTASYNDDTYAVRDLSKADNFYMTEMKKPTSCGWLSKKDGKYIIEDCGEAGRIRHEEIDKAFPGIGFAQKFKVRAFNAQDNTQKTSEYKYEILGNTHQSIEVGELYKSKTNAKYDERQFCNYQSGGRKGTLVVTGQPTPRKDTGKMGDGKGYEFVFFSVKKELKVSEEVMNNFLFAYFDERSTEPKESPDWKYWKEKMNQGEKVPVFFQKKGSEVAHFGLSFLYKLPYTNSVKAGVPPLHNDTRKDLAQTMFGYIGKNEALKGRIQFSHFKATQNIQELKKRTEILGTPRASYYPIYVRQYNTDFKTFMGAFNIAGRKRYPVHKGSKVVQTTDTGNENVGTTFAPLREGVVFNGKVRYHNLKKAELGALLSALTFHNTESCFHSIGLAKPLGYGKVSVSVKGVDNIQMYLNAFELEVSTHVREWLNSPELKELLTMASEQQNSGSSKLAYMELKAFADNKSKSKSFLDMYTKLENIQCVNLKSTLSEEEVASLSARQEEQRKREVIFQEKRKKDEKHKNDWKSAKASNNEASLEAFKEKYPESEHSEEADRMLVKLKKEKDAEKLLGEQQEALDKWVSVEKAEEKYKQKALEDYIAKYPSSPKVAEAKKLLASMKTKSEPKTNVNDLADVDNARAFKNILESIDTKANADAICEYAVKLYGTLSGKKKRNFFKDVQLGRFVGNELEQKVKDSVK